MTPVSKRESRSLSRTSSFLMCMSTCKLLLLLSSLAAWCVLEAWDQAKQGLNLVRLSVCQTVSLSLSSPSLTLLLTFSFSKYLLNQPLCCVLGIHSSHPFSHTFSHGDRTSMKEPRIPVSPSHFSLFLMDLTGFSPDSACSRDLGSLLWII